MNKHRNRFIKGTKNTIINDRIIKDSKLEDYASRFRILEHFYHVDTYKKAEGPWRLQGYVYPEDIAMTDIYVPVCEVAYMDDRIILYMTYEEE